MPRKVGILLVPLSLLSWRQEQSKQQEDHHFVDVFSWDALVIWCSLCVGFWPWDFPSFKSGLFQNLSSSEELRGHFGCPLICRTSGLGETAAPTRLPLVKQMRHSLDWWSDWSWGCEELTGTPSSTQMPATPLICCLHLCLCFHVCFVVNPPVRLRPVCYRGQSKECKRVGQSGHQRANQSVMDFPVTDTQLGSPSSRCRSRLEVFLGLSVRQVAEALCAMTLKLRDCQKHSIPPQKKKELIWCVYTFILAHIFACCN